MRLMIFLRQIGNHRNDPAHADNANRNQRRSATQLSALILPPPRKYLIGINIMPPRHNRYQRPSRQRLFDNPPLLFI